MLASLKTAYLGITDIRGTDMTGLLMGQSLCNGIRTSERMVYSRIMGQLLGLKGTRLPTGHPM
jgi:hypothetical protein